MRPAKKSTIARTCVCLAGLAPALFATAADGPGWRFERSLTLPDHEDEALTTVMFDSAIYSHTRDDLADVRILDETGAETPFLVRTPSTTEPRRVRNRWAASDPQARPLEDGGLEVIVSRKETDPVPNGLTLVTPLKDYERQVRVFQRGAGEEWIPIGQPGLVFDYSRFLDTGSADVRFPESGARTFRIVIDSVTEQQESQLMELTRRTGGDSAPERQERIVVNRRPFRIDRIEFFREIEQQQSTGPERKAYPLPEFTVSQNAERRETLVTLRTSREPLLTLTVRTPSRNFSRRVRVEIPDSRPTAPERWRSIATGSLTQFDVSGLNRSELEIGIPDTRSEEYRLVIENQDSPPLEIQAVDVQGSIREAVFIARPEARYRIAYGREDAEPARYDTAAIRAALDQRPATMEAVLGAEQPARGGPPVKPWTTLLSDPWILIPAIGLLGLLLTAALVQAARQIPAAAPEGAPRDAESGRLGEPE
ncbi:MAG: DUF3999 family protein [Planctomyces sp.]|nr:DUF3999 family protein [Planctomyces sp.]